MHRRKFLTAAAAASIGMPALVHAQGSAPITLRVGTLAPKGSTWMRVFNAWGNTVEEKTNGQLKLHFYSGGSAGDERDTVRKMRAGQLDAAVVTTNGLGQIVRSVLVLQAPGVCTTYKKIDAVRTQLASEFEQQFEGAGFKLLGWGDAGRGKLFSNKPIKKPSDMKETRMWEWRDDPTWSSVLSAADVSGVSLGLPEVYPALRTDRIDAFPSTAIAAVAFQWYTKAAYVTREPSGIVIGATVVKKETFDGLPDNLKQVLIDTGKTAHQGLATAIRRDDDRALSAILEKGVSEVSTADNAAQWNALLKQARDSLVGKLYSADLLGRVEQIAGAAG